MGAHNIIKYILYVCFLDLVSILSYLISNFLVTSRVSGHKYFNSQNFSLNCEAQARVRQGSARDGSQGERPQSLNPCLELTLKLVATFPPPTPPPKVQFYLTNGR